LQAFIIDITVISKYTPYAKHVNCTAYNDAIIKPGFSAPFFAAFPKHRTVLPFTMTRTEFYALEIATAVNTETLVSTYHSTECIIPVDHNCVSHLKTLLLLRGLTFRYSERGRLKKTQWLHLRSSGAICPTAKHRAQDRAPYAKENP
jgi:hypothetical protein